MGFTSCLVVVVPEIVGSIDFYSVVGSKNKAGQKPNLGLNYF